MLYVSGFIQRVKLVTREPHISQSNRKTRQLQNMPYRMFAQFELYQVFKADLAFQESVFSEKQSRYLLAILLHANDISGQMQQVAH